MKKKAVISSCAACALALAAASSVYALGGQHSAAAGQNEPQTAVQAAVQTSDAIQESEAMLAAVSIPVEIDTPAAPEEVYDPPFVKTYVDNSPEAKLERKKESIASANAFEIAIREEYAALCAEREQLTSSEAAELSAVSASRLAEIDARLAEMTLNHGDLDTEPEIYTLENKFVSQCETMIFSEEEFLMYIENGWAIVDARTQRRSEAKLELGQELLARYANGEDVEALWLDFYAGINYICSGDFE